MKDKIRWGMLGTSFISGVMVPAIRGSKHGVLAAVAGRTPATVEKFAKEHAIPTTYLNYQEMIDSPDIDAIYIGLPNHLHHEWMIKAAKAGKHILCEKPFTISVEEAEEAIACVKENNVFCGEAIMYRYHPFTAYLKNLIDGKIIGEIESITASYSAEIAHLANPHEGGAIRNLGCYPLSLVRYLMNAEPVSVKAIGRINPKTNTDSESTAKFTFSDNRTATIKTVDDIEMAWEFVVRGALGNISIITNPWLQEGECVIEIKLHDEKDPRRITFPAQQPLYTFQIDLANDCIMKNDWTNHNGVPLSESLANTKALEMWRAQVCPAQAVKPDTRFKSKL
jgi:predicted dehydrogenase